MFPPCRSISSEKFLFRRSPLIRALSGKSPPPHFEQTNNKTSFRSQSPGAQSPPPHPNGDDKDLRSKIQNAVLLQVEKYGWTSLAIDAALKELGLSPAAAQVLPAGIATVATDLDLDCNRGLAEHLHELKSRQVVSKRAMSSPSTDVLTKDTENHFSAVNDYVPPHGDSPPDRAAYAMRHRLSLLDPYHQFWYQAVGLRPRVLRDSVRNRLLLVDEIAAYAEYNSPNMSWYVDRAVLGTVYQAAELYWITDTSPARRDTTEFIEMRLHNAHSFRTSLKSTYSRAMNLYDALSSTATTLLRASRTSY